MTQQFEIIDGIKCYDSELARYNNQYPSEVFEELIKIEDNHFWFQSRNRCISSLVNRFIKITNQKKFLEIGCGTGVVLNHLKQETDLVLSGADIHLSGLALAKKRLSELEFIQLNAIKLPFNDDYDAIGTFDVLEHIEEDVTVIKNIYKALKPNGLFFISVPQYTWMWSEADDEAFHKRRYSRKELIHKLTANGFKILYCGSFVFTLFPFMALSRITKNLQNSKASAELEISPILNSIFKYFMRIDESIINAGFELPLGGSILCVAIKTQN